VEDSKGEGRGRDREVGRECEWKGRAKGKGREGKRRKGREEGERNLDPQCPRQIDAPG
jgi:hypothetical protein